LKASSQETLLRAAIAAAVVATDLGDMLPQPRGTSNAGDTIR